MKRSYVFFNFIILTALALGFNTQSAKAAPPAPTSIDVPMAHCSGVSATYTVASVPSATYYEWTITGTGWSPTSATTTAPVNYLPITAGTGTADISVKAGDNDGVSAAYTIPVTPMFVPDDPTGINKPGTHCVNSARTYTVDPVANADYYEWIVTGDGWSGSNSTGTTVVVTNTSSTATGYIKVSAHSACGSSATYTTTVIPELAIPAAPSEPVIINTLATDHCRALTRRYQVNTQVNVDEFNWSVAGAGWSISTPSTTNEVDIVAGAGDGTITVYALNDCGTSSITSKTITPVDIPVPGQPGAITVPVQHCNGTEREYSVAAVAGAEWYNWSVEGAGWAVSQSSGTTTDIIAGPSTGTITVIAENACGVSLPSSVTFTPELFAATPGTITGVTDYHCAGTSNTYTIAEVPGVSEYLWTVSGAGWAITSSSNTTTCVMTAGTANAVISVASVNQCGAGTPSVKNIYTGSAPATPTEIIAPAIHCAGTSATYTVPATPRAGSFQWVVIGDAWSIAPTTTDAAVITSGPGSATITCMAINECGVSSTVSLVEEPVHIPARPGEISEPEQHCVGTDEVYAIAPVPAATSYEWRLVGSGWTGSSTISEVTVTAGTGTASLAVRAINQCGYGEERIITIVPSTFPDSIANIDIPNRHCVGETKAYSVMPVNDAISYKWEITSDVSGGKTAWSGHSTTDFINLTAGEGSATISVYAMNECGAGKPKVIVHEAMKVPTQPAAIVTPTMHCPEDIKEYSIPAVAGATSYVWEVTGTGWSGVSTTNSVSVTAGYGSGKITVIPVNACGQGIARSINVNSSPVLDAPAQINKPQYHCRGSVAEYSVPAVPNAVSYEWTIEGEDWSGASTGLAINVLAGDGPGKITCAAINSCGAGEAVSINVTPEVIPSSAFRVSSDTVVVNEQNLTVTYLGSSDENATYEWNFDGGVASPGVGPGPHTVTWNTIGDKTVTLRVTDKTCESLQTSVAVYVRIGDGVEEYEGLFSLSIAPNPSDGNFRLNISEFPYADIQVSIYDMLGKEYFNETLSNNGGNIEKQFDFNQLNSGVYMMKLRFNNQEIVKQINIVK